MALLPLRDSNNLTSILDKYNGRKRKGAAERIENYEMCDNSTLINAKKRFIYLAFKSLGSYRMLGIVSGAIYLLLSLNNAAALRWEFVRG